MMGKPGLGFFSFDYRKIYFLVAALIFSKVGFGQSEFDAGEPYGLPNGKQIIQEAILRGNPTALRSAIFQCRKAREKSLGMPLQEPLYRKPDTTEIDENEVDKVWNGVVDQWMVWEPNCPETPFQMPMAILGYAIGKGPKKGPVPEGQLRNLAALLMAQQAGPGKLVAKNWVMGSPVGLAEIPMDDPCSQVGAVQRFVQITCKSYPDACPTMQSGPFAGKRFVVADQSMEMEWFEGQLIPHQSLALEELLLAFQLLGDSSYLKSALEIGAWCLAEKPVSSPSLTARLAGGLALLYDYTGKQVWKEALQSPLTRVLLPSVLIDLDSNGLVDGHDDLAFHQLNDLAKTPGRLWDGYGASSWQTAAFARAVLQIHQSYVNQGDTANLPLLQSYLTAVFNCLLAEINQKGTPPTGDGFRDLCLAILDGHYFLKGKLAIDERKWERAIRILWNARVVHKGGEFGINVAQFYRYMHPEWPQKTKPDFESGRD